MRRMDSGGRSFITSLAWGAWALAAATPAVSAAFQVNEPTVDRWMYNSNGSPGIRNSASAFGAVGEAAAEDRFGQMLVRFDTTGIAAVGLGASNYLVNSIRLTLTVNLDQSFFYDQTKDALGTYTGAEGDSDTGRPLELFGAGYRNGFTRATFAEDAAYGDADGRRNVFAAGYDAGGQLIDVSDNVRGGFEVNPFSVGQIAGLTPGELVPLDSEVTFDLDLSDPFILAYVQEALNAGALDLILTSLTATSQEADAGFPSFYTKENFQHNLDPAVGDLLAGRLSGEVVAVPEPTVLALLVLAGIFLIGRLRRARL